MRGRRLAAITLSDEERGFLEGQARSRTAPRSLSTRCRIILSCAKGLSNKEVALALGHSEHTVGKWRSRFAEHRLAGLSDKGRTGRPRTITQQQVSEIIRLTLTTKPKTAPRWTIRSMAEETGLSHTTIRRIWTAWGLRPHRADPCKSSR